MFGVNVSPLQGKFKTAKAHRADAPSHRLSIKRWDTAHPATIAGLTVGWMNRPVVRVCDQVFAKKAAEVFGVLVGPVCAARYQSALMNGHDPYFYLKDALTRLPT